MDQLYDLTSFSQISVERLSAELLNSVAKLYTKYIIIIDGIDECAKDD